MKISQNAIYAMKDLNIEELRKHQQSVHKESSELHKNPKRESAPGDVTVF